MRVKVGNVPVVLYADAWVDVPDGTTAEELDQAITDAVKATHVEIDRLDPQEFLPWEMQIDEDHLDGWSWQILSGGPEDE